jgi:uncharacterized protein YjbJ (UPF0337 family)
MRGQLARDVLELPALARQREPPRTLPLSREHSCLPCEAEAAHDPVPISGFRPRFLRPPAYGRKREAAAGRRAIGARVEAAYRHVAAGNRYAMGRLFDAKGNAAPSRDRGPFLPPRTREPMKAARGGCRRGGRGFRKAVLVSAHPRRPDPGNIPAPDPSAGGLSSIESRCAGVGRSTTSGTSGRDISMARSSSRDKSGGTLDKAFGRLKEASGALTGKEGRKARGQGRQAKGSARKRKGHLKDLFKRG